MKIPFLAIVCLSSCMAAALGIRDFGRFRDPDAFSIHESVKAGSYPTEIESRGQPVKPAFAPKVVTSIGRTDRSPLVVTSVRYDVNFQVVDLFQQSRQFDARQVTERTLGGSIRKLIADTFGPGQGAKYLALDRALEDRLIRRPMYMPEHKSTLDYTGPLAIQILSRDQLTPVREDARLKEIAHQPVAYVGITVKWWEPLAKGGFHGAWRILRTFDSRDVDVRTSSTVGDFRINLPDAFEAMVLNDSRAILKEKNSREVARMKTRYMISLLDEKFGTIAEFPLARAQGRRWVTKARPGRWTRLRQACAGIFR